MYIVSFYTLWALITYLLGWLFNLDFNSFNELSFYLLSIISLALGFVLSFALQLGILSFVGEFRKGTQIDNKFNHRFASSLLRLGIHLLRVKVTVTGKENIPEGNFVLVGNHQENYDIIVLKPIFRNHTLTFISKESLNNVPIFGKWILLLGNIPISRYADRSAAESIVKGIKQVRQGHPMGIFPEGRRSFANEMIDFKPGAFKLATKPKADILIVTIYDFSKILKQYPWKRQKVYVHIHKLMKYEEYEGLSTQELAAKTKTIIQAQLDEFKKQYE